MINNKIIERLCEIHFGEELSDYTKLLDSIFSCQKLADFKALNLPFDSSELAEVFDRASKEAAETKAVRPARFELIFKQIKAVQSNVDFI